MLQPIEPLFEDIPIDQVVPTILDNIDTFDSEFEEEHIPEYPIQYDFGLTEEMAALMADVARDYA
jgi:hypothetical protein